MSELDERRIGLKALRLRLDAEAADLAAETKRLAASHDLEVLREHSKRLKQYHETLQAFIAELELFHQEVGPLGP